MSSFEYILIDKQGIFFKSVLLDEVCNNRLKPKFGTISVKKDQIFLLQVQTSCMGNVTEVEVFKYN